MESGSPKVQACFPFFMHRCCAKLRAMKTKVAVTSASTCDFTGGMR